MTTAAVKEGRKPGRPRKFAEGRINATVRFTPERYAELKAAADKSGRSVSEQVETMIEELLHTRDTLAAVRTNTPALRRQLFRYEHRPIRVGPDLPDAWWPKADPNGPRGFGFIKMTRKKK